ncbi:MAG: PKD domain-containing protein [Bacteroidota bacterium]
MKCVAVFFCFLFSLSEYSFVSAAIISNSGEPSKSNVHGEKPVYNTIKFTENKNQWNQKIQYCAQLDGGALFLEKNCFTYNFYDKETLREHHIEKNRIKSEKLTSNIRSHAFRMTFLNAEESVEVKAQQVTSDYFNFFIGNDKTKWAGNVKNYQEVNYLHLYKGIDLQVLGLQNSLKYNFIVSPQGNASEIQLYYEGLDKITLEKGALKLVSSLNEIVEQRPFAYQWIGGKRVEVPCEFSLKNTTVSFHFPRGYTKGVELVIDPVLVFACSSGSVADNFGMTATYDSQGNLYSGGTAFGAGYPVTLGAYDNSWNGSPVYLAGRTDVVISKYDATGTFLQYSTYLGGSTSTEIVSSLVVNAQNELLLVGATGSSDFPVTAGAYDVSFNGGSYLSFPANGTEYNGGTDLYVAKFNNTGTGLLACSFIGGTQNDGVNNSSALIYNYGDYYRGEIQVDNTGNCYIASCTYSSNFPVSAGCAQPVAGGGMDGIAFKMDQNLSSLLWSTYVGGSADDGCYALAVDDSLTVYTTGGTASSNFPVTAGTLSTAYNGGITDGFVTKIKKDGTVFLNSTFIGTPQYDQSFFIQLDKDYDVYLIGQTQGVMPVSAGVYSNANSKQFIWKLNNSLSTQVFTTIFGNGDGTINISPSAFLVDYCENIYVSGWGGHILLGVPTNNMPLTGDAIQPTTDGFNFYLFVLSTDATSLLYATYFGGAQSQEHVDGGTSRFDKKGIIYQSVCAGCGGNDDFPVTPGAWPNTGGNVNHNTQNNNCNNGVFKFDFQVPIVSANFTVNYANGCSPVTVTFNNQSSPGSTYLWDFGGNDTSSTILNPTMTYSTPGTYLVRLYVNDPSTCNLVDTAYQYVTVYPNLSADFDFVTVPCTNQVTFNDSSEVAPVSWLWHFDDGDSSIVQNPQHTYDSTGTYDVQLIASSINGCKDTVEVQINFIDTNPISISTSTTICEGNTTQLTASGGYAYSWTPATDLSNAAIANPIANPDSTTIYTVSISSVNGFGDTCIQTLSTTVTVADSASFPLSASVDNDTIGEGESTIIHAITDTTIAILWSPAATLNNPSSYNPVASPTSTTTYTVTIVDSAGCPKTASVTVYVVSMKCNPADIFVPNTFTPNGDGNNDLLFVRGNEIRSLYFAVYNRWGELVFETTDMKKGWDGMYKGLKADPAVFGWYIKAKCFNEGELKKKGNVTLIR